jgi:hypothetical protein
LPAVFVRRISQGSAGSLLASQAAPKPFFMGRHESVPV